MIQLYNTLTKQKEEFTPINPGKVGIYTCGPTVYDYIHIGNIRAYMFPDILRRYMEHKGFEVRAIKNITDVGHMTDDDIGQGDGGEDKMLKKALAEKKDPLEIARFYENAAKEDEVEVNILPPHYAPRATEHVQQMISAIEELITRGHAYQSNGSVFMDVESFPDYGKLSGNTLENLEVGARLDEPHPDKRSQWDFALWLKAPENHLMKWDSPWGTGYPGWHIECTAMSTEYLGNTFDIHTGGEDNIFPHHEAEIAQTECATGQKFVNYWLHTRHLMVDGGKMSKSKGTGYTLRDIKEKGYAPMDLRMLYIMSHYRSQMNFTWEALEQAKKNLDSLTRTLSRINESTVSGDHEIALDTYQEKFDQSLADDLNTPLALSTLLELSTEINKDLDHTGIKNRSDVSQFLVQALEDILGFITEQQSSDIPQDIVDLAEKRKLARTNKDFEMSDELRGDIAARGYLVEDTADGYTLTEK